MAWIQLNASDPPPPSDSDGNVHFRQAPGHAGTSADPIPTSAFFKVLSWVGKLLDTVTMGAPADGQVPTFDAASGTWKAKAPTGGFTAGGDLSGTSTSQTVVGLEGKALDATTIGAPADAQFVAYDGTAGKYKAKTPSIRTIGISFEGSPGVPLARRVQVAYSGTIIGWGITDSDATGSITCEVDKHASSAPPSAPAIPNTTTDKISGSAPIAMSGAQSASGDASSVSSWTTTVVVKWDVVQFNITALSGLTRGTIELYIQPN